jgi:hypothetical protein
MIKMADLKSTCPVCDEDIIISERAIKLSVMHMGETAGNALVGCPNCCRVLILPGVDGANLDQWISDYDKKQESGDWLECLPFLDDMNAKEPNGFIEELGVKKYTPGDSTQAIPRRAYMVAYGIDPECALAKMRGK